VKRQETKAVRVMKINVKGKRRRRRLKNRWLNKNKNDMRAVGV
jgi:hypothetical protein